MNLAGCLLLGAVLGWAGRLAPWTIPAVAVGLCGALTTFSAFAFETVELARADRWAVAAAYVALTVPGAVGALLVGRAAARATPDGAP